MSAAMYLAAALAGVFAALAFVHVYWAFGRQTHENAAIPKGSDGRPLFRPGRAATVAVAVMLFTAAVIVLGDVGMLAPIGPIVLYRGGVWVIGVVLLLRTIGDFNYVGLFKRHRVSRFARLDSLVYTPLCAALAAGSFYLAAA
jgi:hypothetical protein